LIPLKYDKSQVIWAVLQQLVFNMLTIIWAGDQKHAESSNLAEMDRNDRMFERTFTELIVHNERLRLFVVSWTALIIEVSVHHEP
jgi:hypothetical protein